MSAKKKQKPSWITCDQCFKSILSKHEHKCNSENECYYYDGLLFANVNASEGVEEQALGTNDNLILLHPATIKYCGFQVACSAVVQNGDLKTFGTLWPSSSIALGHVHVSILKLESLQCNENQLVSVHKIDLPPIVAESVTVEVKSNISDIEDFRLILSAQLDNNYVSPGESLLVSMYGKDIEVILVRVETDICQGLSTLNLDKSFAYIFKKDVSSISFASEKETVEKKVNENIVLIEQIGGLQQQIENLDDCILNPLNNNYLEEYGITSPKGIILYGPSGTGKTILSKAYVNKLSSTFVRIINGPELTSKYFGETEESVRQTFLECIERAPSVLIVDEFDTICSNRSQSNNELEKRIVATFCTLMDSIPESTPFVVVALTNKLNDIDPGLRRPGRFEKEIEFSVPNSVQRLDILSKLVSGIKHNLNEDELACLANDTHGYVGGDLSALTKEAGTHFIKMLKTSKSNKISIENFKTAMCKVRPSALKAMTVDVPKVFWEDVGGQDSVKQKLKEAVEWPLKHSSAFSRLGIKPPCGVLLYGPPGCSKTMMAKALATESGINFISIKGPELFNKYLGESERAVRELFHKARVSSPTIVFFDEIDALGVQRKGKENGAGDKVLAQLLTELDGVEPLNGVTVIAATNRPDIIDPALIRPGRIDRMVYVPLPDKKGREEIFTIQFRSMPVTADLDIESLVMQTEGYSGAEICSVCQEAGLLALRDNIAATEITNKHFIDASELVKPGTSIETIEFYDNFSNKH